MKYSTLKNLFNEEQLKGGVADGMTLADIANKHGKPFHKMQSQYKIGIKVELEHTDDTEKASEIIRDHLWEDPDYYTRLGEMESEMESEASDKE